MNLKTNSLNKYIRNYKYELKEIDIKRGNLIKTRGRLLYQNGIQKRIEKGKVESIKDLLKEEFDKTVLFKDTGISIEDIKNRLEEIIKIPDWEFEKTIFKENLI
jgi:hypothetical protein